MTMMLSHLWSRINIGYIALQEGNLIEAKEVFHLTIQQFQKGNSLIGVVCAIEGLANMYVQQNQVELAAPLLAWADATREKIDDPRPPVEQVWVERDWAVIHSQLTESEFVSLSHEGQKLNVKEAVALASGK
jgi:hypothetical protein